MANSMTVEPVDQLSEILQTFQLQARVFFSGNLCELSEFEEPNASKGHLHLFASGKLSIIDDQGKQRELIAPCLLFFAQGRRHRLLPDSILGANLVCATIEYNSAAPNPIALALPSLLMFQLDEPGHHKLAQTAQWIFDEAANYNNGQQYMLNKLCDIFVLQVLRQVIASLHVKTGMLAGLGHKELSKVLLAIHQNPQKPWRLESLASQASMSRSKFARVFHDVVGQTPLDYLTDWRIQNAQNMLAKNMSVHIVANNVGYENGSVLARVFKKKRGLSPKQWLAKAKANTPV